MQIQTKNKIYYHNLNNDVFWELFNIKIVIIYFYSLITLLLSTVKPS